MWNSGSSFRNEHEGHDDLVTCQGQVWGETNQGEYFNPYSFQNYSNYYQDFNQYGGMTSYGGGAYDGVGGPIAYENVAGIEYIDSDQFGEQYEDEEFNGSNLLYLVIFLYIE